MKGREMKTIKAWAVVDKRGELQWCDAPEHPMIRRTEAEAASDLEDAFPGERVVPVTITVEDE